MVLGELLPVELLLDLLGHGQEGGQLLLHKGRAASVEELGSERRTAHGEAQQEGEGG